MKSQDKIQKNRIICFGKALQTKKTSHEEASKSYERNLI